MIVMLRCLALLAGIAMSLPAAAQQAAAPSSEPAPGADAAQRLADLLRDDAAREALIAQLLAAAQEAGVEAPPAEEPAPLLQLSAARMLAEQTRALGEQLAAFMAAPLRSMGDVLGVFTGDQRINWTGVEAILWSIGLVAAVTLGIFLVLRAGSHYLFRYLTRRRATENWLRRAGRNLGYSLTDGAVILIAWAAGYVAALFTGVQGSMDFRQSLFLNAFLLVEMTKVVIRAVFMPGHGTLRFAPMGDETAAYWYFWASRLVSFVGYGLLLVVPLINSVVSFGFGRSVGTLIVFVALLITVLIVLQNRVPVRDALRARKLREPGDMLGRLLAALGSVWHILAIAYMIVLFMLWTTSPANALAFMGAATLQSAVAVLTGVLVMILITRAIAAGLHVPEDLRRAAPLLEDRLNTFVPGILRVIRALVVIAVLLGIVHAWQLVDVLGWLVSDRGSDLLSRVLSAAFVLLAAWALWLVVTSWIEYRLNPERGRPSTARERTLMALFRNAFTVTLVVVASMLALAQLGMNIAPLLAGAGVVGLAVAFGGQKLVSDIINGIFIQIDNAMNEGDVVTVGATTGVVEKLTIRSVGLRDMNGTYHLIPFSMVDQVSNFMRGFGYHVANIGVAYREDTAQVKRLMQEAFDRLLATEHGADIVGPFEMHGVAELSDSAVVVRGRIKTRAGMQWGVGRAYTEIVKQVLDEAGVEIPFPHVTLYMGEGKDGTAPPLHIRRAVEARARAPEGFDRPAAALPAGAPATP
jgi:small conductance mechanosensitive channel